MKPSSIFNIFKKLNINFFSNKSHMEKLIEKGVQIIDVNTTFIEEAVSIEKGTVVFPSTYILGESKISTNCIIGPNSVISNSEISSNSSALYSIILDSNVGKNSNIGPYSYVSNNSFIEDNVEIGNFVEVKSSKIGSFTKSKHLSYLGDLVVENNVNLGAGFVSANFDGTSKNKSKIEKDSFIGSNSTLVSPLTVGKNTIIGAGSVVLRDVPEDTTVAGVPAKKIDQEGEIDD